MSPDPTNFSQLLLDGAASSKKPVEEILRLMLQILRRHLGMEVGFISQFKSGRRYMRLVDSGTEHSPITEGHSDPLDESYCQLVVQGRIPQLIHDAADIEAVSHLSATHELPVGAHISVPLLLDDGSTYGTLCCFSTIPDGSLTSRDLDLVNVFAEIIRQRLDEEIRKENTHTFLYARLSRMLADQSFYTLYQPIFNFSEERVIGLEALTRFNAEPARSPDKWFSEAVQVGMQVELESACLLKALEVLPLLPEDCYLSVNLSPEAIISPNFKLNAPDQLLDRIVIEITEHAIIDCYQTLDEQLKPLRRKGLRVAVDDAGAGYASFKHILALNPDIIKLDMSLVRSIDTDFHRRSLAMGLMSFTSAIGCKMVAEGVETEGELETLKDIGVNKAQGYLIGKPMDLPTLQRQGYLRSDLASN